VREELNSMKNNRLKLASVSAGEDFTV